MEYNALKEHLNVEKTTVEKKASGNPLGDFLNEEKHINEEPEPQPANENNKAASAQDDEQENAGSQQNPRKPENPEPQFKKDFDWTKSTKYLVKGLDHIASRLLKVLAKSETRKKWQLSDEDIADIMEWAEPTAKRYNISVENPLYGLMGVLLMIYGEKTFDAYDDRQKALKRQPKPNPGAEVYNEHPSEEEVNDLKQRIAEIRRKRAEAANQNIQDVELIVEEPEPETRNTTTKTNAAENKQPEDNNEEFDFERQIEREFHAKPNVETNNSTANGREKSTVDKKNATVEKKINAAEDTNLHDTGIYIPVRERPGFAVDSDPEEGGAMEAYAVMKADDKKGRETEIVRCRMTRQLFERLKGSNKNFITPEAKNRYHYFLKLQAEGKEPKGGFPGLWNKP